MHCLQEIEYISVMRYTININIDTILTKSILSEVAREYFYRHKKVLHNKNKNNVKCEIEYINKNL